MAEDEGPGLPTGPPTDWPTGPVGEPSASEPAPTRRRRWPWVLAPVVVVGLTGAAGAVVLLGDDGDEAYCEALDTQARDDVDVIAFLEPDVSAAAVDEMEAILEDHPDVTDLRYVDRDEAFAEAQELFAGEPRMQEILRPEDVPTSFRYLVADADAALVVELDLHDLDGVLRVEDSTELNRTVWSLARLLDDDVIQGGAGRFGHLVAPDRVERLEDTAPGDVADEVTLVLEALNGDSEIEQRHRQAAEDIIRDGVDRCGFRP